MEGHDDTEPTVVVVGSRVMVIEPFPSDDKGECKVQLSVGFEGIVRTVDEKGDVVIKFDPFHQRKWVRKTNLSKLRVVEEDATKTPPSKTKNDPSPKNNSPVKTASKTKNVKEFVSESAKSLDTASSYQEAAAPEGLEQVEDEAEEKARQEALAKAKRESEEKARQKAAKAEREAEETARQEALAKAKCEAEEKARQEALAKAKREAEEKAKQEAAAKAKHEAEEKAKQDALSKATCEGYFAIGEHVEMKDKEDTDWQDGYVISANPLKVAFDADAQCGHSWDEVKKKEAPVEMEAEASPASPERKRIRKAETGAKRKAEDEDASRAASGETCDKCDGNHATDKCPHFKGAKDDHKDAWVNIGRAGDPLFSMGSSGGNFVLESAEVVQQPGDGSCLFHSLTHGLRSQEVDELQELKQRAVLAEDFDEAKRLKAEIAKPQDDSSAMQLRKDIASFIKLNPTMEIEGDTLEEIINWDSVCSVESYAGRMEVGDRWGGGIELAVCSRLKQVNVHVYEKHGSAFKRISCFDVPSAKSTIHVLYQGRCHYDALVVPK